MLCVIAPFSLPVLAIPFSLASLAILAVSALLGAVRGVLAVVLYLLIGLAGIPVFSGFLGGVGCFVSPTGGFLLGYLPFAFVGGIGADILRSRFSKKSAFSRFTYGGLYFLFALAATALLYLCGCVHYCLTAGVSFPQSLSVCVLPFLPFDLLKCALAAMEFVFLLRRFSK